MRKNMQIITKSIAAASAAFKLRVRGNNSQFKPPLQLDKMKSSVIRSLQEEKSAIKFYTDAEINEKIKNTSPSLPSLPVQPEAPPRPFFNEIVYSCDCFKQKNGEDYTLFKNRCRFLRDNEHMRLITDFREGCIICTECGIVVEQQIMLTDFNVMLTQHSRMSKNNFLLINKNGTKNDKKRIDRTSATQYKVTNVHRDEQTLQACSIIDEFTYSNLLTIPIADRAKMFFARKREVNHAHCARKSLLCSILLATKFAVKKKRADSLIIRPVVKKKRKKKRRRIKKKKKKKKKESNLSTTNHVHTHIHYHFA